MRLYKFLLLACIVTSIAVTYVWQQSELVRLAYAGQAQSTAFQDLLDKNSQLRYSLKQSTSLIHLADRMTDRNDFQMPRNYCFVKLTPSQENVVLENNRVARTLRLVYRLFGVKREAEAKTLNR